MDLLLKEYDLWDLFLHKNQFPYLGKSYAWAKGEFKGVNQMTSNQRDELFDLIIPEWEMAVNCTYGFYWTNVACAGNRTPHLHWHLIPRRQRPITRHGITFIDPNPEGNYSPYERRELPDEVLFQIRNTLRVPLNDVDPLLLSVLDLS